MSEIQSSEIIKTSEILTSEWFLASNVKGCDVWLLFWELQELKRVSLCFTISQIAKKPQKSGNNRNWTAKNKSQLTLSRNSSEVSVWNIWRWHLQAYKNRITKDKKTTEKSGLKYNYVADVLSVSSTHEFSNYLPQFLPFRLFILVLKI